MCNGRRHEIGVQGKRSKFLALSHYTLLECLIVISIIVILASLLLPLLQNARELGNRAACQSNLKQWGLAIQVYAQDYNSYLPSSIWYDQLKTYVGSKDNVPYAQIPVFRCPTSKFYISYVKNYWISSKSIVESERSYRPSVFALMWDGQGQNGYPWWNEDYGDPWYAYRCHSRGMNVIFLDGHLKFDPCKSSWFNGNIGWVAWWDKSSKFYPPWGI